MLSCLLHYNYLLILIYYIHNNNNNHANMLEQGPDLWRWFDTTQFSCHCVHPTHAKVFSIRKLTIVDFDNILDIFNGENYCILL